jgi:hypothetical protein
MNTNRSQRSEHTWILVEGAGPEAREVEAQLRALSYEVCVCRGPTESTRCSLVHRGDCSLINAAEVVVNALVDADPSGQIADLTTSSSDATVVRIESQDGSVEVSAEQLVRSLREARETEK